MPRKVLISEEIIQETGSKEIVIEVPVNMQEHDLLVAQSISPQNKSLQQTQLDESTVDNLVNNYLDLTLPTPKSKSYNKGKSPNTAVLKEVTFILDRLEVMEVERIKKELQDFQTSRRKLAFDLSSLTNE